MSFGALVMFDVLNCLFVCMYVILTLLLFHYSYCSFFSFSFVLFFQFFLFLLKKFGTKHDRIDFISLNYYYYYFFMSYYVLVMI